MLTDKMVCEGCENYLRKFFDSMCEGFALHQIVCDANGKPIDYRFLDVNPAFELLTGLHREDILGKTVLEIMPDTEKYWIDVYGNVALTGEPIQFENYSQAIDRHFYVSAFSHEKGRFVTFFIDITERKKAEERITYLANYDSLTKIANRGYLMHQLSQSLKQADRGKHKLAIMLFDIDKFKKYNDEYGHHIGDEVLKYTAEKVCRLIRSVDTVGRLGGDEFVIIQPFIEKKENAEVLAKRILDEFEKPVILASHELALKISIGISIYPDDGETKDQLMRNADAAMYMAKQNGGNHYKLYNKLE